MFRNVSVTVLLFFALAGCSSQYMRSTVACLDRWSEGLLEVADERHERFLGKVNENTAVCRGDQHALQFRETPWVDWSNYFSNGDQSSRPEGLWNRLTGDTPLLGLSARGHYGAIIDLEFQRFELIRFNLFDNSGTYAAYIQGRPQGDEILPGLVLRQWDEMRLPEDHPKYLAVGGADEQICAGALIRFRNLDGICNDVFNPLVGSAGMEFGRNVEFEETFPEMADGTTLREAFVRNRHGDRIGLFQPDPNRISRELLSRSKNRFPECAAIDASASPHESSHCNTVRAPFLNVLASFWIQFMVHDWFAHLDEGENTSSTLGELCKAGDGACELAPVGQARFKQTEAPATFTHEGKTHLGRAPKTSENFVTAWWDASQLYGYSEASASRVKRDPLDTARLAIETIPDAPDRIGQYLPLLTAENAVNPRWVGQDATGFADNWNVGLSFFHNLFAREHNDFVAAFREHAARYPGDDSGLRNPEHPERKILYAEVSDQELFEIARLVVSAEIAKIHTIEWTTQLLYDDPLYTSMNGNWNGLFHDKDMLKSAAKHVLRRVVRSEKEKSKYFWHPFMVSFSGIFASGNEVYGERGTVPFLFNRLLKRDQWNISKPDHLMAGVSHFGSPFNFPEEFVTVYRLHPLVPDLLEYREWNATPDRIQGRVPMLDTFRSGGTQLMRERGIANLGFSMGRQRLGALVLNNAPAFLQALPAGPKGEVIDTLALDIVRDRERGVPRYNEFRRQIGLKSLRSFDDFVDQRLPKNSDQRRAQQKTVQAIRDIYGTHSCKRSKVITQAQVYTDGPAKGQYIDDCLGHPDGSEVDNVEDLDVVIGMLAEFTRPHGFAISETQFQIFIINAARRIFSDRFLTSGFRPEFYSKFGIDWVNHNGPGKRQFEPGLSNGHKMEVSPLKRVLLRNVPELAGHLEPVINAFDPWGRDRGDYYSLAWKPGPGIHDPESMPRGTGWRESEGAGEQNQFAGFANDMAALVRDIQVHEGAGRPHRPQHAKMLTGTDNAAFSVSENMPAELKNKLFQPGATYPVTLRFSNAAATINPDEAADLRGIAMRIYADDTSHDLLMTNAPLHHARDPSQAMAATRAFATRGKLGGVLQLIREIGVYEGLRIAMTLHRQSARPVESLATETFWSRAPFRVNQSAVKFRLVPIQVRTGGEPARELGQEFQNRLLRTAVEYRLEIQWFRDAQETSIELGTANWGNDFVELGTITIPMQDLGSQAAKEMQAQIDAMQFNPWFGDLEQLRPLGGLNRVRDPVYRASSTARVQ